MKVGFAVEFVERDVWDAFPALIWLGLFADFASLVLWGEFALGAAVAVVGSRTTTVPGSVECTGKSDTVDLIEPSWGIVVVI
jgi:hypothetical protein